MNGQDGNLDALAWFGTFLGLANFDKNSAQQEDQKAMQQKLDLILAKLDALERREQN